MTITLLPDTSEFQWPPDHFPGTDMEGIKRRNGGAAIIRQGYGATHPDASFVPTRRRAHSAGMAFLGIYQYIRKDQTVTSQADAFCRDIGKLGDIEVPMPDLEEGDGDQGGRLQRWLDRVENNLGKKGWPYSGAFFAVDHGLAGFFWGLTYHTWVAAYSAFEPALGHTLWQCTDGVAGVGIHQVNWPGAGSCDTSLYHGTAADLGKLTHHPAPAPVQPHKAGTVVKLHITAGHMSLKDFCIQQGTSPARVLADTVVHYGGHFPNDAKYGHVRDFVNDLLRGTISAREAMPANLHIYGHFL